MENKFMKYVYENKWFVVFYLIWSFIHFVLYFSSDAKEDGFWPFSHVYWDGDRIDLYDFLELFVYLSLPIIILVIWKLIGKDIERAMNQDK